MVSLKGKYIYMVGIKGTGTCALAELCHLRGGIVTGSDVSETFYTDEILDSLSIPVLAGFSPRNIPGNVDIAFYSPAYDPETNCELIVLRERGVPLYSYPMGLGKLAAGTIACGIAGVHGKTTTTAIAGSLVKALGIPAQVVAGSPAADFGGRNTWYSGDTFFIAETCEYRKSFLHFKPDVIVFTSCELDHPDYYPTYESIREAFLEYIMLLPKGGVLVYCNDDAGARETARIAAERRPDIRMVPYGFTAQGAFRMVLEKGSSGRQCFRIQCVDRVFSLAVPGMHNVLNACGALAGVYSIVSLREKDVPGFPIDPEKAAEGFSAFAGTRRRSEIVGEKDGILFIDDYAHHPSAVAATLRGYKEFYPGRRLVVDFMLHTYTRTQVLFDQFAACFRDADLLILNRIYGSAREKKGTITDDALYNALSDRGNVFYCPSHEEAAGKAMEVLKNGDIFVTMGAGDNWKIGRMVLSRMTVK